jgi:hypothetical protein
MLLAVVVLFIILGLVLLFKFMPIKVSGVILSVAALLLSAGICIVHPKMHKPFTIDIVEYFIKINDDGSMTTTKQTTKTIFKQKMEEER